MNKIIAIVGPTSSGKSALAIRLARKFDGEVISADSRQVYRGLDVGSGKITKQEMAGIPHHLLSIANPKKIFTVADYTRLAKHALRDIWGRGRLPIICGGTGFYVDALLGTLSIPPVSPNPKLRERLAKLTAEQLFARLQKLDPERAKTIDRHNPRRLVRAIEVANVKAKTKPVVKPVSYMILKLGLAGPPEILKQQINRRVKERLRRGLSAEVKKLHRGGLSWKRLDELGLDYRYVSYYLRGRLNKEKLIEKLAVENWRYAKRQMTWFKRDKTINWLSTRQEAERLARDFLAK